MKNRIAYSSADLRGLVIENEKVKGAVAIIAAVIMFFMPNHIDLIIESLLAAFGMQQFVLKKKD